MATPHMRAFTLIEVIIVVGLLALLLGLLLPALESAHRASRNAVDLRNLHELASTQASYTTEHRGEFINPFSGGAEAESDHFAPCDALWYTVTRPVEGMGAGEWPCFRFDDPGVWRSEMYAFHWYSLLTDWLGPGGAQSEVQWSPGDPMPRMRFVELTLSGSGGGGGPGRSRTIDRLIWDGSYVYSPTMWFDPERYGEGARASAGVPDARRALVRRTRVSEVLFPAAKVFLWERFDTTRATRRESVWEAGQTVGQHGTAHRPPNWNNPGARTNVATVDGSVTTVAMGQELFARIAAGAPSEALRRALTPTDSWDIPQAILGDGLPGCSLGYCMGEDGLENGSGANPGRYPAFFWATRHGTRGRDILR